VHGTAMAMEDTRTSQWGLRLLALICAAALLLALFKLPIGYYTFLRLLVTAGAVVHVVHHYRRDGLGIRVVLFGILALLFNPLWPVYLQDRDLWAPVDILGGVLFLASAIKRASRHTQP
jgi:hypothetical protein